MRVENRILLIAFFLLMILASSAGHDDGLRGGSRVGEDNNRNAQFPIFPSFFAFLWSLLGRLAGAVLSVPTALLQFLLSVLFSFLNCVIGIFVSVSSPFATTTTTTTTLVPTTAVTTLAATTSSTFFSTETTIAVATSSTEMTNPATSSSAGTAMSTVPTAPTSMLLSTSTVSSLIITSSTSTSTSSTSTSTTTSTTGTTTPMIPRNKTVFLTSIRFLGDLGGLEGGDNKCNDVAQSVSLPGMFFAWLSNATHSPNTRFTRSLGPYLLVDGTKFADNYTALVSSGPLVPLSLQENNVTITDAIPASSRRVWTGTNRDGDATINHCNNWQSNSDTFSGTAAEPLTSSAPAWAGAFTLACLNERRLYCFEQ